MLISISGAQGVGKSTLLSTLSENSNLHVENWSASRVTQREMGIQKFEEICASWEKMIEFQQRLVDNKIKHEHDLKDLGIPAIVERSFLDVISYTELHVSKFDNISEVTKEYFLTGFKSTCFDANKIYSQLFFIRKSGDIPFEYDPARGDEMSQDVIDQRIEHLHSIAGQPFTVITTSDLQSRKLQILKTLGIK